MLTQRGVDGARGKRERKPKDAKGAKTRARKGGSTGPRKQGERRPKDAMGAVTRERGGSEHPNTQRERKPKNARRSTGRCKEDETKRPKPKEKITEEGVHPHPGPPAMSKSTDDNANQRTGDKRKSLWETSDSEDQRERDDGVRKEERATEKVTTNRATRQKAPRPQRQ